MNAFEVLGLEYQADKTRVHQAYRSKVKACHPDLFEDPEQQKAAQKKLIELNLAYEEALKMAPEHPAGYYQMPLEQALASAENMLLQKRYDTALMQLGRAEKKDDRWYFAHGRIMMGMEQYATAHQAFRQAVRMEPDNREYHAWALDAALLVKKHQKLPYRVADWAKKTFGRRKDKRK